MKYLYLFLFSVIAMAFVALGNRVRGGLWGNAIASKIHWGSTTARIVAWGMPCLIVAELTCFLFQAGFTWQALLVGPLMWIGATTPNFNGIDLGTRDGTFWGDVGGLTLHGILVMVAPVAIFGVLKYNVTFLCIAGLLNAPCYIVAYRSKWTCERLGVLANDRPPMAELLFGAVVALAIVLTFFIDSVKLE